jgi:phosphatidate cytidylyltransferase
MLQRALSAAVLIPIVVFFAYQGGFLFAIGIGLVAALALNEFFRMLSRQGDRPLWLLGGGATALLILHGLGLGGTLDQAAIALIVFGGLLWELGAYQEGQYMRGWALTIAGVLYIGWAMGLVVALRNLPDGFWWLVTMAVSIWASDTGAYLTGRFLGGRFSGERKFSPRWSPNKTWEGVIGGILVSLLVGTLLSVRFLDLPVWQGALLGLLLGPTAVAGDLAESMVKRRVGVKDSGDLIPGHGGMLDRIDSILFGAVVTYFFAVWVVY